MTAVPPGEAAWQPSGTFVAMDVSHTTIADPPKPGPRWYVLTPDRLVMLLLVVEGLLLLSEQFGGFAFDQHKG